MKINGISFLSIAFAFVAISCGRHGKSAEDAGMLEYAPQTNEVEVIELQKTDFQWQLLANGRLSASAKSRLAFPSAGTVTELNVHNGQRVCAGEEIASLDSREKALALEAARIDFDKAELDFYDNLAGLGYPARDTTSAPADVIAIAKIRSGYVAAKNARQKAVFEYESTVLRAPFGGVVADLAYGQYDTTGSDPVCTLIDDSAFDVDFMILESEYPNVSVGMKVRVTPFGSDGREAVGTVESINPTVDKNGQILVRARVSNNSSHFFVDGMNVRVIVEKAVPGCLVVPKSAVVIRDQLQVLFKYVDGRAKWTYVRTVLSNSESYAVEANTDRGSSLSEGDKVIVSGNLNLADNSEVVLGGTD